MLDPLDADEVARIYSLGVGAVITGPVARGEVGQVWKLTTDDGVFAIKEPFERPDVVEVEDDAAFQDLVAATGLSMPPVIRTVEGRVLADIGTSCVRVYGWVDLLGPDRTLEPVAVGAAVAAVHRVRYSGANGLHPWYTDPVGADRWDELVGALRAANAPFAERLAEQRDELVALEQLIRDPSNVQACHRDLFADNVLPTTAGEVCIIDWENSGLADPGEELALVLFEFSCGSSDRARSLHAAYRDHGGIGVVDHPGSFSMVIAQLGHIGELSCQRWLDPQRWDERLRNEGRVEEFLTEGISRDLIEMVLDSISS